MTKGSEYLTEYNEEWGKRNEIIPHGRVDLNFYRNFYLESAYGWKSIDRVGGLENEWRFHGRTTFGLGATFDQVYLTRYITYYSCFDLGS